MNLTNYDEIQDLLRRHNFKFSKSMGQNFLVKSWVPEDIANSSCSYDKTVIEIGPGIGCLTRKLSEIAKQVYSIELDKSLMPILSETLAGCDNVEVIFGDALKMDLPDADVVCANLPYNITSPILTRLALNGYEYITVMIQKEVAERICSKPATKEYGSFGIFIQWYYECEKLFDVSRDCFIPQPKVTSSVIRLKKREIPPCQVKDEKFMFSLIRASFNQRRKTLINSISNCNGISKEKIAYVLDKLGYDLNIRGEALTIGDFAKISDELFVLK